MSMQMGIFGSWPEKNLAIISSDLGDHIAEIEDRLSRRDWKITVKTDSSQEGIDAIANNKASVLLIEDTLRLPASLTLALQLRNPVALLTPTVIASPDSQKDKQAYAEIGLPESISQPINPARFLEAMEQQLRRWSNSNLKKAFAARKLFLAGHNKDATKILSSMLSEIDYLPLLVPAIAYAINGQSDPKVVEKILLNGIKELPRNMGLILSTIDFYLSTAMPSMALRIIDGAKKSHGNPSILIPEQIQANLLMNKIDECIPLFEELEGRKFHLQRTRDFLTRCHYTEGNLEGFMDHIDHRVDLLKEYEDSWSKKA